MYRAVPARVIGSLCTIFNRAPGMNGVYVLCAIVATATGLIPEISIHPVMIIVLLLPGYSAIISQVIPLPGNGKKFMERIIIPSNGVIRVEHGTIFTGDPFMERG